MRRVRVIPVLLIKNGGLVKSVRFKDHKYVGDPINAVRIFNEKEVDEIVVLDISATSNNIEPNLQKISEIAGEAFMPMAYGGGIKTLDQIKKIFYQGIEKVVLNKSALENTALLTSAAKQFGSQSIVASVDVKKDIWGRYRVYCDCGTKNTGLSVTEFVKKLEQAGAGEIFLNSIDQDGTFRGYDQALVKMVSEIISIPVVACGGASSLEDFRSAVANCSASAVAAGSMFVFQGPHRAVLISYPSQEELNSKVFEHL